jgi:hypothetical protein
VFNLTVEKKVTFCYQLVNLISVLFAIGLFTITITLINYSVFPNWSFPVSLFFVPIVTMFVYRITSKRLSLRAFQNIEDIHELKRRFIEEGLLDPSDFISAKQFTSIKSKAKWNKILLELKKAKVFYDDMSIQSETIIYNYKDLAKKQNPTPRIILNENGIHTIFTGFYSWDEIRNETIITRKNSKMSFCSLFYEHKNGNREIELDDLTIDSKKLTRLMKIYRGRFEENSNHQ